MKLSITRGIAGLLGFLFIAMVILSSLAFEREDDVNTFLHLKAPGVVNADVDTQHYKSEFTADGLLSEEGVQALIKTADDFVVTEMEEGAVLLINRDGTLPLAEDERSVTLFGRSVADPIYKNASGGPATVGSLRLLTLHDAFVNGGFSINETLFSAYQNSTAKRSKYGTDTVTKSASSGNASIGEERLSFYNDSIKATFEAYSDAAIVMFSREAGEGTDSAMTLPMRLTAYPSWPFIRTRPTF